MAYWDETKKWENFREGMSRLYKGFTPFVQVPFTWESETVRVLTQSDRDNLLRGHYRRIHGEPVLNRPARHRKGSEGTQT
jgi:hypothetical protein